MIARLELELKCKEELSYQMASVFHGALMELLPPEYADDLHLSKLHPYTLHLEYRQHQWYWVICALNQQAVQVIIRDTLWDLEKLVLKKKQLDILIGQKRYEEMSYQTLMEHFYREDSSRYIQLHFVSPTAFKQNGQYVFYPDIHCIFQSLMNKYDAAVDENVMSDQDTLVQLCENTKIIRYDLKSTSFSLEGIRIPSFIGKITIKMTGTQTMANFANLLFIFGTYAGIGIKTALGMGCIRMNEERRNTCSQIDR